MDVKTIEALASGEPDPVAEAALAALKRMAERHDESLELWAHRLAADLGKFTD